MTLPPTILLKPLTARPIARMVAYGLVIAGLIGSGATVYAYRSEANAETDRQSSAAVALDDFARASAAFRQLREDVNAALASGFEAQVPAERLPSIQALLAQGESGQALAEVNEAAAALATIKADKVAADESAERQKGVIEGKTQPGASVYLKQGEVTVQSMPAGTDGSYSFRAPAGTYTLAINLEGYVSQQPEITIAAGSTTSIDYLLSPLPTPTPVTPKPTAKATAKPTPTPTPTPAPVESTDYSRYYTTTLTSSRGNFSAKIMSFELGPGKIKVVADTASDGDCATNCPVLPVKSYVTRAGGFAGINGTYFCPQDYSGCSGEVNHFFWKVLSGRTGTMVNAGSGLGENDPFLSFSSTGIPKLYSSWNAAVAAGAGFTGINHKPLLVNNGSNVLNESGLDEKQLTSKITRAAVAVKDTTLYVVHISSATIPDLAAALDGMNIDYALNIDSGGSAGMYYNGSYKTGPGRGVPNALVFVQQ